MRKNLFILLTFSVVVLSYRIGHAQNYSIDWFTIDGGGGTSTGGCGKLA